MDRGPVQRIGSILDSQEPGGLFEGLVSKTADLGEFFPARKRPMFIAVLNDRLRQSFRYPGYVLQQIDRCSVQIYTDGVHGPIPPSRSG